MKPITNKYGFVHGGYLFYLLDKTTHEFAVEKIGECLTWNVNIYYHQPVLPSDIENIKIKHEEIFRTNSTILIQSKLLVKDKLHATAMFTFVRIKNERKN
jgi:acyl-coenzyme A thioesterase PaaI-like protein